MGNRPVSYKSLPEESANRSSSCTSLPAKMDTSADTDSHFTSIEIEPESMQEENGKKWFRYTHYSRSLDNTIKRYFPKRCKPALARWLIIATAVVIAIFAVYGFIHMVSRDSSTSSTSSDTEQKIQNVYNYIDEKMNNVTKLGGVQDHISEQILSLEHNISQLQNHVSTLHSNVQQRLPVAQNVESLSAHLDQIKSSVTRLSSEIHSPLNLYNGCKQDTASCRIDQQKHKDYWRECPTKFLPLKLEGWYTLSYQCQYKSDSMENMEALTPFVKDGKVRCDCDVTLPGDDSEHHRPVAHDISAECTLVIERCPLSQTLF